MYIVDTFLVVVFGGAESLVGAIARVVQHRASASDDGVLHERLDRQGAHRCSR
jgi:hypothetical protein